MNFSTLTSANDLSTEIELGWNAMPAFGASFASYGESLEGLFERPASRPANANFQLTSFWNTASREFSAPQEVALWN